jgi:alpha-L-rhamnosidase
MLLLLTCCFILAQPGVRAGSDVLVEQLRCEYLRDPLGIDVLQPRLSWILESETRGQMQTAYQVQVASSIDRLAADQPDLWDSGKIPGDRSVHVAYAGRPLKSHQPCFWRVRVWDSSDEASAWSDPASWTMGILRSRDWCDARWIGLPGPEEQTMTSFQSSWIWYPEGSPAESAPAGKRYFLKTIELDRAVESAHIIVAADNFYTLWLNGEPLGTGTNFRVGNLFEIGPQLEDGTNRFAIAVENAGDSPNPAGLMARLEIHFTDGSTRIETTDESWKAAMEVPFGWETDSEADVEWKNAMVLGENGIGPWGDVVTGIESIPLPALHVRREFGVLPELERAVVYLSGLGLSELYLNGRRVTDDVLSPGLTEYPERVFYVTRDVTGFLSAGENAIGVLLGNGRYMAPRLMVPMETKTYGYPKLLFHLRLEYADGSVEFVVSDDSWRITDQGPIRENNEYDGEVYDARMELSGWAKAGYDDSSWLPVNEMPAPGGALRNQSAEPIRVVETIKPIGRTEPSPGVYIFDMGQNMVGWCRLRVSGPEGACVKLRHAEVLDENGFLYLDNIRSARVTDRYYLKGEGEEEYEPRFTYHGFRFVEVTGYPGEPTLDVIEGRVVHDDLTPSGTFASSNELLNRIYHNILWGVRGNYRSIPTDCPQRDERQGWLGDRSAESTGESYLFDVGAFYNKWLDDIADAQTEEGSVPDVAPSYWPIYSDNVTWPSSHIVIPWMLYVHYGDARVIERRYASMKRWIEYMTKYISDDLMPRDQYGDWCVPPESPELIHSQDPSRKTAGELIGTAYYIYDLELMQRYARLLGYEEDARDFESLAAIMRAAFNLKYFKGDHYDNGSQTSSVLPLAFGLVPEDARDKVFDGLVRKIEQESKGHIGTGLIGAQWLMRVLTAGGRPDLGYRIATQKDYPSWGYMIEQGATTIWELWNGDTADPAMNSRNHVMLVGDLLTWMNESLAGIAPDPTDPGFKHILMYPCPVPGLDWAKARLDSPYGRIASYWQVGDSGFVWEVTIPVNTYATLWIPAESKASVSVDGESIGEAEGMNVIAEMDGRVEVEAGSGVYRIVVKE